MKIRSMSLAILLILVFFLLGCGAGRAASPASEAAKEPAVSRTPVAWQSDGVIGDNEYTSYQKVGGGIEVYSRVNGDTVMFGIRAAAKGYVSIGIGAEEKMKGADILMCSFKDGAAVVTEMVSSGPYGPHPPMQSASTVSQVSGKQQDGVITIEFSRKLAPDGAGAKPLKIGENPVIWAVGDSMDISQKHTGRGNGTLVLVQ
ncbi:MAG: DOMON domain-containing protein [Negativicutes bacterium]|nr:DOMON domain-containing protein [Negativicutes bacterium]MDR3592863.1 DOMON domain-containing protein [Negativicutes bacterium]